MQPDQATSIFLSYSWRDKEIADQLDRDLVQMQMNVIRDVRDLAYRGKISDFMETIRASDYAILLISDSYLKSKNCMTEVLHLLREREFEEKLLPVIVGDARIYSTLDRLEYTAYWQSEFTNLQSVISQHSAISALSALADLKTVGEIHSGINEFISYISDIKHISFTDLKAEGYKTLLHAINYDDITHLVRLLKIAFEQDYEKKEEMIEEWLSKHQPTADAYLIRASTAKAKGEFARAEWNYQQALQLNPQHPGVLNNYGYLLLQLGKDWEKARDLFEEAVRIAPTMTQARVNLGFVLTDLGDAGGAEKQYEQVLTYDPTEAKAYNNLANLLQQRRPYSSRTIRKVSALYEQAILLEPDYIEAHLNYGTFLSVNASDFDEAEVHFKKALAIDPSIEPLVAVLLQQNERLRADGRRSFKKNALCPCKSGLRYKECCAL
jgi:Tfp pilus assembly protein PilF